MSAIATALWEDKVLTPSAYKMSKGIGVAKKSEYPYNWEPSMIAHITFNIPYVILNVLPKLKQSSRTTYEAALDLGATPLYAFFKIIWPQIRPGVFSGFLMAMTMSLDDFSVTYFTKGAGIHTLSTMIYTEMRKGIRPEMYALSTILFLLALVLLLFMNFGPSARREEA